MNYSWNAFFIATAVLVAIYYLVVYVLFFLNKKDGQLQTARSNGQNNSNKKFNKNQNFNSQEVFQTAAIPTSYIDTKIVTEEIVDKKIYNDQLAKEIDTSEAYKEQVYENELERTVIREHHEVAEKNSFVTSDSIANNISNNEEVAHNNLDDVNELLSRTLIENKNEVQYVTEKASTTTVNTNYVEEESEQIKTQKPDTIAPQFIDQMNHLATERATETFKKPVQMQSLMHLVSKK
jgi:hypothetical protein